MRIRPLLSCLVVANALSAQGTNCVLLGTQNLHAPYNDIWGYAAPNGKEYALVGTTGGTSVVDVTNPATPIERGFFAGPSSTWRDIRTYLTYAYVVTEGGGGFQILDLTNADAPVLLGTFGAAQFGNAHNISIDRATGRIYCLGTNNGTPVFDAATNPTNPPFVGNALPRNALNPNSTYFHDMQVENGFAYGAMIYNGTLRIMNTTALPLPILSNASTPGVFTHNCWPNAAGTVCVTTDEVNGGVVKFFDITNKLAPVPLGQFTPNSGAIVHNAFIVGNICHVSWYTEGYRAIDITDPSHPVEVASYDTWPGASGTYDGAWGVYPFLPSGNILVNDISTGLYIVRPLITNLAVQSTTVANTTNEDGPYPVFATVTGTNPLQSVNLSYRVNGGAPQIVAMTPTGNPNQHGASIPGQNAIARVTYHVDAADNVAGRRSPQVGENEFFVGTLQRVFFDDGENDPGWTHGFTAGQDDWQRGQSGGRAFTSAGVGYADAGSAYSGTNCWGNDLGIVALPTGTPGNYSANVANWLQSPLIPTQGVQGLHLRYRRWLTLAPGDVGRVLVNGTLIATVPATTVDTSWQWIDHDISAIANTASSLTLRFELVTDATAVAGGWTLDDFEIYRESDCVPATNYGAGTAGSGGFVPTVALAGEPRLGAAPQVTSTNLLGGSMAALVIGFQPLNLPVLGVTLLVDGNNGFLLMSPVSGAANVPGVGAAAWQLLVPTSPTFDNLYVHCQVGGFDAGSPGGSFSASSGMRFRICTL